MKGLLLMLKAAIRWRVLGDICRWLKSVDRAFAAAVVLFAAVVAVDAKGIPASIVERRGLTNEQIDYILEKRPDVELKISRRDWQGMRLELMRFHNLTNWVDHFVDKKGFADALATAEELAARLKTDNQRIDAARQKAETIAEQWRARSTEMEQAAKKFEAEVEEAKKRIAALDLDILDKEKRAAAAEARVERLKAYLEDKAENGTALQKPIYKALLNWYNSLAD